MTDTDHKHEDVDLLPGDLAKRRAAGRVHKPRAAAQSRVEKTEAPKKKSFFERKED